MQGELERCRAELQEKTQGEPPRAPPPPQTLHCGGSGEAACYPAVTELQWCSGIRQPTVRLHFFSTPRIPALPKAEFDQLTCSGIIGSPL